MTDAALAERARPRDQFVPASVPVTNGRPGVESYDLAELPEPVQDAVLDRLAPSTQRAYRQAWRGWQGWCEREGAVDLPASPVDVAGHVIELAEAGKSMATIRLAVAGIDAHHRVAELYGGAAPADVVAGRLDAPGGSRLVRETLATLRKRADGKVPARGKPTPSAGRGQAAPLTAKIISWIERTAGAPRARGPRGHQETPEVAQRRAKQDVAIAWCLYEGLLRRGELAALTHGDLTPADDGGLVAFIRPAKSDSRHVYLRPAAARAIDALGPGQAGERVIGLTAQSISRRLQAAVKQAVAGAAVEAAKTGIPPDLTEREVEGISGHSGRVGMVQALTKAGAGNAGIMQAGGWKSPAMVARYAAKLAPEQGVVATFSRAGKV